MATPRRATGRVAGVPRRVGRVLEHGVQSDSVYNDSLDVDKNGRLGLRIAKGEKGLIETRQGIMLDPAAVGEKNRPQLNLQRDLASGATVAEVVTAFNALLAELKRTKNMLGGGF